MSYRLFIDDDRYPPDDGNQWIIARSSSEAIDTFKSLGPPEFISFDHDLGGEDKAIVFVNWMIDMVLDLIDLGIPKSGIRFPQYTIHSQNPIGAENIDAKMKSFIKFLQS